MRNNELLIDDIVDSCRKILEYTNNMTFEEFSRDEKTIDACIRNFEIIGEAANNLSEDFKNQYNHINWKQIVGFRNRLIHAYFGVDIEILWNIIYEKIAELMALTKK